MARLLTCVQGHAWEVPDDATAVATGVQVLCPVCGAAVDMAARGSPQRPSAEAATFLYAPAVSAAETETLAPGPESAVASHDRSGAQARRTANAGDSQLFPATSGYEVLEELGRGGMGVVLKARQTKLDRLVALKVLPPQSGSDPAFAERFSREARALARLSHPHIVTVHDFGQVEGHSYIVMEFIAGINLRERLRRGRLPLAEVLAIMRQLCDALQYAHDEGIVHRDVKPENILLDKHGRVRIADFGLAKLTVRSTVDYTLTGPVQVMGTWNYMAPEQLANPQAVDHRADIYALGVVFYEMLTGDVPRVSSPVDEASPDAPFVAVALRALAREPERRYQRIEEFGAALEGIAAGGPDQPSRPRSPVDRPPDATGKAEPGLPKLKPIGTLIVAALCLVCWPAGLALVLPLAIWLWLTLRQPDGKLVLKRRAARAEEIVRAATRNTLGSTTVWAFLASSIGIVISLQPYSPVAEVVVLNPLDRPSPLTAVYGYNSVFGIIPALILSIVILLQIAIPRGDRNSIPVWRAALLIFAGTAILLTTLLLMETGGISTDRGAIERQGTMIGINGRVLGTQVPITIVHTPAPGFVDIQTPGNHQRVQLAAIGSAQESVFSRLQVSVRPIAFTSPVLGTMLLFLGSLQIRGIMKRKASRTAGRVAL